MSTRESGSDTWPRFASFPGDNLDLGNAPEEDDVDHRTEPPSWLSGAAPVGTGADPPDADTDGNTDGGQSHPAGNDNEEAPAYGGSSYGSPNGPTFGDGQGDAPDFGEITTGAHDFSGISAGEHRYTGSGTPDFTGAPDGPPGFGAAPGYADAPAETPDFSGPPPDDFPGPSGPGAGFGGDRLADPFDGPGAGGPFDGRGAGGFGGPRPADASGPGFAGDQLVDYGAGQFAQSPGGYGPPPPGDPFGGSAFGGPQGFQAGQENGMAATQGQAPPFQPQYPPVAEPPGGRPGPGRMTASLRTVKRPRSSKRKNAAPGRQAQLTVARVEPWSVMKFSFVISLVAFIVFFVAVAVLYGILSGLGVFSALQHTVSSITSSQSSSGFNLMTYLSASRVLGYTGLLGAINVVLITALSTVGSVLYNITADLAGGVEITLKETD
jgi:hypothetical protein